MRRRKAKIVSKATKAAVNSATPYCPMLLNLDISTDDVKVQVPISLPSEEETDSDRLFHLIYEESRRGYCFTEPETGISWIRHQDIEDKGNGLFVIRFRCPTDRTHAVYFGKMADAVCKEMNSIVNFFHATKSEEGLAYEDCVWVIQKDSIQETVEEQEESENEDMFDTLEEFPDNFKDESTTEEMEARFADALENFV